MFDVFAQTFDDLLQAISLGVFDCEKWLALISALESLGLLSRANAVERRYQHYSKLFVSKESA